MREALQVLEGFPNYIPGEGFKLEGGILPLLKREVGDASRYRTAAKAIAEDFHRQQALGGVFLLHDQEGQYRLGYVEFLYRGRRKPLPRMGSVLYRPDHPNKTFRQRLRLLEERARKGEPLTLEALREALSVDAVTEEFYREFARLFEGLVPGVRGAPKGKERDFLLALVARVLFLAFVAKRGWLGGREDFLPWLLGRYRARGLWGKDRFYSEWLSPLFFGALKGPPGRKGTGFDHLPQEVREAYLEAPYLNGELFRPKAGLDEKEVFLSDEGVGRLFDFLFAYNFTVEENTAYEVDLELNPEFLGLILERLVNTVGVEGKATELGAHYTPRVEVDLMVRLGLAEVLHRKGLPLEKAYALMQGEVEALEEGERTLARDVLLEAKVLDPAVGSGAFLVGTLQVLEETLDFLGVPRTLDRKKRLLQNLHGVDILSWAVWMAELRLWLAYFLELPDQARASEEPLLPSLGLKVVQGDSVVQRVGQQPIPTRLNVEPNLLKDKAVQEALSRLVNAKEGYFHNRGVLPEEVRRLEGEFLLALLEAKAKKGLEQGLLVKGKYEQHQEEVEVLREALDAGDRPFLYLVDFAEVMAGEGGFDLVIGNPPYVRQEEIQDPLGRYEAKDYKAYLQEEAKGDFRYFHGLGNAISISGRSDLYTYFYLRTLALLKPTGVHVFIASNSWLDVQYGAWLQEVFLRAAPLRFVIENRVSRSFRADVNVAITVAWAPREVEPSWKVRFLAVEAPFEEADLLGELRNFLGGQYEQIPARPGTAY